MVTGPSGAGKSSLVFDTVFAEGQRRFVESMSTYARQFLDQMERPPVADLRNVLPAVALEAKNSVRNARSTVGTITEIHDVLRLLFAHLGEVHCPNGHGPARRWTPGEAADDLAAGAAGERFTLVARLARPKRGADEKLAELVRLGFARRLERGEVVAIGAGRGAGRRRSTRCRSRSAASAPTRSRWPASPRRSRTAGSSAPAPSRRTATRTLRYYGPDLGCAACGATLRAPTPALFSFNSPLGACPTCEGFGRVIGIDSRRVIPDPSKSLAERPIAPWNTPAYEELYDGLYAAAHRRGVRARPALARARRERPRLDLARRGRLTSGWRGSSAGSKRAPTRCTCAYCSRATAPTTPARIATARA